MIYPYRCKCCGHKFEVIKSVKEIDRGETCPQCKNVDAERYIGRTHFYGASVEDIEYNPGLGCLVKNKKHRAEIVKRNNLIEVGNENPEKLYDTMERDRTKKLADSWNEV